MPRRFTRSSRSFRPSPSDLAALLHETVNQLVDKKLERHDREAPIARELRRVVRAVTRLERRLETLSGRINGSRTPRSRGSGRPGRPPTHTTCTLKGCTNDHYARGLCSKHYQRRRRRS